MSSPPLRDVAVPRPKLLLVGINPSLRSGSVGHHFAGNGNPFWRLLFEARLIPEPLSYEQDQRLAAFGIGLTNLCARATRAAAELTPEEIARGRQRLTRKIQRWQPEVVAFIGLSLYQSFYDLPRSGGAGAKTETIAGARVFVVPNPSGLNASFPGFKDKLIWFQALAAFLKRRRPADRATAPRAGSRR